MEKSYSEAVTPMDWAELVEREFPSLPAPARASERATTPLPSGGEEAPPRDGSGPLPAGQGEGPPPTNISAVAALLLSPGAEDNNRAEPPAQRRTPATSPLLLEGGRRQPAENVSTSPERPASPLLLRPNTEPRVSVGQQVRLKRTNRISTRGSFDAIVRLQNGTEFEANIDIAGLPPRQPLDCTARLLAQDLTRGVVAGRVIQTIGPDRITCRLEGPDLGTLSVGDLVGKKMAQAEDPIFGATDIRYKKSTDHQKEVEPRESRKPGKRAFRPDDSWTSHRRDESSQGRAQGGHASGAQVERQVAPTGATEASHTTAERRHSPSPPKLRRTSYPCPIKACTVQQGTSKDHLLVHAPRFIGTANIRDDARTHRRRWEFVKGVVSLLPRQASTLEGAVTLCRQKLPSRGSHDLSNKWMTILRLTARAVGCKEPATWVDITNLQCPLALLYPHCLLELLAEAWEANPGGMVDLLDRFTPHRGASRRAKPPPSINRRREASRSRPAQPREETAPAVVEKVAVSIKQPPVLAQAGRSEALGAHPEPTPEDRRLLQEAYKANQRLADCLRRSAHKKTREAAVRMLQVFLDGLTLEQEWGS
ncbi:uncharacterized protein [Antedon mediterranea]|uniref:uncharacterized protein n=1 Tax=Antedon mediterranea TaxID=105859 RepID=UPI003AF95F1D